MYGMGGIGTPKSITKGEKDIKKGNSTYNNV